MARRLETALASIFLPRDSIYSQLDEGPPSPTEPPVPPLSTTRTTRTSSPPRSLASGRSATAGEQRALQQEQQEAEDDDPFAVDPRSTSVISHHSHKVTGRDSDAPPASPLSATPSALVSAAKGIQDSVTPFHDHPFSHSQSQSQSSFVQHPQPPVNRPAAVAVDLNHSLAVSSIGNKSLIGLLGGTRYDFHGAGLEGVGGGIEEELEEEEDGLGQLRAGGRVGRIGGMSLAESRHLASSLPPPPSALSPSTSPSTSEDEDEDEPPSDLTSRIPLSSSSSRSRQRPRPSNNNSSSSSSPGSRRRGPIGGILGSHQGLSPREKALWRWINVEDLDGFLQKVYLYYVGKGVWTMVLGRVVDLLTVGWVISFSTFLVGCIDYTRLWEAKGLSEVVVPQCVARFSTLHTLLFLSFSSFYLYRLINFGLGVRELWEMKAFFEELLGVGENDIQTIPWSTIVTRLSALRASHPSALSSRSSSSHATAQGQRLDAHDVANRIMREENYLIALFNKDVLDLSLPWPHWAPNWLRKAEGKGKGMLTKTLQWNLEFCLVGFLFGRDGQVRRAFLGERNKGALVEALRRRFILMGIINAVFAPFIVLYLLMYSFFRYFEEYHQNPSSIGSRTFTPLARWHFREFNELPHLFSHRLSLAHPLATTYVAQFPKAKTALLSRFVAFVAGSFAAVLILFSLIDPDAFLHFEVTEGRTVLFYVGVFGGILAVARGMVPEEHRVVDPEETMKRIVEQTHYCPEEWRGKLHSAEVHTSFSSLFPMKLVLFLQELSSVLLTPFILFYSLPSCAGPIVDFFREFTVHVDGLGYVCSFAVFDFKRHGDVRFGAPVQVQDERWKSGEGKMEKSFLNFAAHNPSWIPRDQTQSLFLSKMTEGGSAGTAPHGAPPPRHAQSTASGIHQRFSSTTNPHARSSSRGQRYAGGGLGASILEEGSTFGNLATGSGGASSLPSSRILEPSSMPRAGGGSRLRPNPSSAASPPSSTTRFGVRSPPQSLNRTNASGTGVSRQDPIIEESNLDGQSFVAPTNGRPFGLSSAEEEEAMGEIEGESRLVDRGDGKQGLGEMLGELYGMQGRRW